MNIQYYKDLSTSDVYRKLHVEENDIDLFFNLRKVKKTKFENINFKLSLDIFKPLYANKKVVIIVTEHFGLFGLKKSIKFYLYIEDEKFKYKGKAYTIEYYISKFGTPSDQYIIEVETRNPDWFTPGFQVIYNSESDTRDEFLNNTQEALVMANCPELGFMTAEYADPYPLFISGSVKKLKPRLCSTCIYFNYNSPIDCAVNLAARKDKMKKDFVCLDYTFDSIKYTPKL